MSRQRKSKLFELFSSDFRVTDFYKPTMEGEDVYYHVLLDDIVKLRMRIVSGVVVIDVVETVTTTYIKPIYEKLVRVIMNQNVLTVIISLSGNTYAIQQACISCNAPDPIDDERYITVALSYYNRLKRKYKDDLTKYGFYILSVGDDEDLSSELPPPQEPQAPKPPKTVNDTPIGVEPPVSKVGKLLLTNLKAEFPKVRTEQATSNGVRVYLTDEEEFVVEVDDGNIYIKDLVPSGRTSLNLIKLMELILTFEKLTTIQPNVYILSIQNAELNRICTAKGYYNIPEEQKLPMNRLFKQAFSGYGTYRINN